MKKTTIIRTAVMLLTLSNTLLVMFGKEKLPFTEDEVYQAVSFIATACSTISVWWYNNSFTQAAIEADKVMKELKSAKKE